MISHERKVIFIHISKCAGTSIESAFGLTNKRVNIADYDYLFGWCNEHKLFLHHATPQQLFDYGLIDEEIWDSYYKFIVIRNPWDRCYSDYIWMIHQLKTYDSFRNFLNRKGSFEEVMKVKNRYYRGDHLNYQKDYFYLNEKEILYDKVIKFENLHKELPEVAYELGFASDFFNKKENISKIKKIHYSQFYTKRRRLLFEKLYKKDIDYFDYTFKDQSSILTRKRFFLSYSIQSSFKMYVNYFRKSLKSF